MDQDIPFERIGGYRVLRRLATGGTSDVLLARAEGPHGFERTVVLKLLLQQFRRDAPMEKMFAREAAAYARLSHPAIVKLYDFFSAEGQLVMVLEFIDGLPLNRFRAMLRKGGEQLDDRASIFVASRVFAALAAAHGARDPETGEFAPVIHRDVNPSNVLIPWDGHVKLADFGIAKVAGVSSDTQAGFIKGTYGYMAPEQVRGEPVTVRTDVYAASLLLWELLARRKAIQRGALPEMEVLRAMAEPSLPSLDILRPDLPQRLREAVGRGLEASPDIRSITADEMLVVLRESVTSNEGRNVLAEMLGRVKQESDFRSVSVPPPAVEPAAASSPAPRAPLPVVPRPRGSQPSIPDAARTALGTGQVAAVSPAGGMRAAPSSRGAQPKGPTPALRPVVPLAPLAEGAGTYRAATSGGGAPVAEERVLTAMGVAPPPVLATRDASAASPGSGKVPVSSMPPVFGASARSAKDSLPPVFRTPPPMPPPLPLPAFAVTPNPPPGVAPTPPMAPSPFATSPSAPPPVLPLPPLPPAPAPPVPADPSSGQLDPTVKVQAIQTPPPALWASLVQSDEADGGPIAPVTSSVGPVLQAPSPPLAPAAMAMPLTFPPPPSAAPMAMPLSLAPSNQPPTQPRGFTPLPPIDRGEMEEIPMGMGTGSRGTYTLVAGVALVASAAILAALFFAHRSSPQASATSPAITATAVSTTVTPPPEPTPAPPRTQAPIATAAPTPTTATPTAATPTPTPTGASLSPHNGSSTEGTITTPPKFGGHRVFVDGKYAGDSPGPIKLHCGSHSVKIGSGGVARQVDVPCGDTLSVTP